MAEKQIWDPLRKKMVALTPEEEVRQWFIGILSSDAKVPAHMMMSEVSLKLGQKDFRADILVYGRDLAARMVVECKRPDVILSQKVIDQALKYNMALNVNYIVITNGKQTSICHRQETSKFEFVTSLPDFEQMCQG